MKARKQEIVIKVTLREDDCVALINFSGIEESAIKRMKGAYGGT